MAEEAESSLAGPYVLPEHAYRLARSLAAHGVPHCAHVFSHGPHSLGLARGSVEAEAWTTLAAPWIAEQSRDQRLALEENTA